VRSDAKSGAYGRAGWMGLRPNQTWCEMRLANSTVQPDGAPVKANAQCLSWRLKTSARPDDFKEDRNFCYSRDAECAVSRPSLLADPPIPRAGWS